MISTRHINRIHQKYINDNESAIDIIYSIKLSVDVVEVVTDAYENLVKTTAYTGIS